MSDRSWKSWEEVTPTVGAQHNHGLNPKRFDLNSIKEDGQMPE